MGKTHRVRMDSSIFMFYCHPLACQLNTGNSWTPWFISVFVASSVITTNRLVVISMCERSIFARLAFPIFRQFSSHYYIYHKICVQWRVLGIWWALNFVIHSRPMQLQMVFSQKLINNICLWDSENCQLVKFIATASLMTSSRTQKVEELAEKKLRVTSREESLKSVLNDRVTPQLSPSRVVRPRFAITHMAWRRWFCFELLFFFFLLAQALLRIGQLVECCMVCEAWHDTFSACCVSEWVCVFPFRAFIEIWNAAQKQKMIKTERFVNKLRSDKNLDESHSTKKLT